VPAEPGPWQPSHSFRLPVPERALGPGDRAALFAFATTLAENLSNLTLEFRFDDQWSLQSRRRLSGDTLATITPAPRDVYDSICTLLQALDLPTIPPAYPSSSPTRANSRSIRHTSETARNKVWALFAWFLPVSKATPQAKRLEQPELSPHRKNQPFETLQAWLEKQDDFLPSISRWYDRQNVKALREPASRRIAAGGEARVQIKQTIVTITLDAEGKTALVTIPSLSMKITITMPPEGGVWRGEGLCPALAGLRMQSGGGSLVLSANNPEVLLTFLNG